ncbi:pyrophosphatase PpaX [Virgibacillus sp. 179-BFC.A HS]|uniref:Pyrophosphatase PpaX n=1 Tax=Tigheibacillus jepli TaxID=3035914 RepID=A0ABU5CFN4_9BACI|nr:pyrophosphatase PpaX [Virgibacillus sp. 179-BFC.A HS]MDY0405118.1 pyrophosphatase PpaX [Virgibacillus sp. 179-BFC.A HS]
MRINTVLFDLDGTLIDTNELINQSFLFTFGHYGYHFTKEELKPFNGPPLLDTFRAIDAAKAEEMMALYRKHNLHFHDAYVTAFPGVRKTITQLKKAGIKVAIVSTKARDSVKKGLQIAGLENLFDVLVTLDEVTHAKPHPEPIQKALALLDSSPAHALMVGDNSHDIEGGKNAGVATAGVAWSNKGEAFLQTFKPTYMLQSMEDLLEITGYSYAENR